MDIYCQLCGEPWDSYELGPDGCFDKKEAKKFLAGKGCPSCNWGENKQRISSYKESCDPDELDRASATSVLVDVLGDDIDGIASELECYF